MRCYTWSPERHPNRREYTIKVPNLHGFQETDSAHSRCQSCSTGHSPVSSPVALKCRHARLTNLLNKNEVLDLYIDGEQEVTRLNEKQNQKFPIRSTAPYLGQGRPPRPHSTAPSSPKLRKEIIENPSNIDIDDAWHSQLAHGGTNGTCKVESLCHGGGHDTRHFNVSSENLSLFEEPRSQTMTTVEDIYEDLQDVRPPSPFFYSSSTDPVSSATLRYFAADISCHEESHGVHDFRLEQETDEKLLQRANEVDACFMLSPIENSKLNALRDKRLDSAEMLQLIQGLIEDRKMLASELSSQIKARLTERFATKEEYKRSKLELETRTRRLEKEKIDIQSNLETELDRRSSDWSVKLERFQSEEQRLRERVRELAEQNVSFQREVTLLQSYKVDATSRIKSLELQNKHLDNELQKVKVDHENLHNSLVESHDKLAQAIAERDKIRELLEDKEEANRALHKIIARLQRACSEQEKTIAGLRQRFGAELEKRAAGNSDMINRMQMELNGLTGVEQNLRKEIQSCTLEMESLRQENIGILNRLQRSEDGVNFSTIRLDQELHARVESLQAQALSLLDDASQLCAKLLELIKSKSSKNSGDVDALVVIEYTLKYQSMNGGIENVKQRLRAIKSLLMEKQNKEGTRQSAGGCLLGLEKDDIEIRLREEAMISRILKEKLLSKQLDIEQLQSDLAASVRIQDVLQNEIQRVQDELRCLTHKSKHLEVQVSKKDGTINQIEQDYQESTKELTALRCMLKTVSDERDVLWQESKQLKRTVNGLQNEVASLKQKIKLLDEDIMLKESEILLRDGEISILRDSIDKPFDICSPRSMKQFGLE
ncbi:myosin-8-like [Panicum miliaceum]|uniref:Myosin-8-like n=1 Tax=Panicum miliaceum TaxID=4540 RepID=A0A3L6TKA9_PANMI|nr:myosin-8-like [Panicum miliaceum]